MTVAELIEQLKDMPQDLTVYAEGECADKVIVEEFEGVPQIVRIFKAWDIDFVLGSAGLSDHKCHTCKHYTSGEYDGSCGSYICKGYSNWESEDKE